MARTIPFVTVSYREEAAFRLRRREKPKSANTPSAHVDKPLVSFDSPGTVHAQPPPSVVTGGHSPTC